jgi:uncharacterized protein (DUF952 family)
MGEADTERLFHLVRPAQWTTGGEAWRPASLESEGFVHLSFAHQLSGTLALHFADVTSVWLLEVQRARVAREVRLEPSRDGERFPHLYGPLELAAVARSWSVQRVGEGWELPRLAAAGDSPAGAPGPPPPAPPA